MNLLLVGSASSYAIEKHYLYYFSRHRDVSKTGLFAAQNQFLAYYQRNTLNKILYRSGLSSILATINIKLKKAIKNDKPDVVFVFKGMEIFPETLQWIRSQGIKLINFNPDNPFIFSGPGSGNENISKSIDLYDLHFTYDQTIKDELEKQFKLPVFILPFGFEIRKEIYERCASQEEKSKACFLGNPDKDRVQFILQLAKAGIPIDVYGNKWEKLLMHRNITTFKAVYDEELWMILSRYRVQLNLMRIHNPHSHNMRTFEIPGVGGIQLAPDTIDHRSLFHPEKEIFLYKGITDCLDQIKKIIALDDLDSIMIRKAARERSIKSGYTYSDRANQVIAVIQSVWQ